ncbi:MAG: hypothetical protein ACJ752_04480 [Gaiellaceae bacterium]
MTETIDQLIQARFEAVANPINDGDWDDVLARSRNGESLASRPSIERRHRRRQVPARVALVTAVVALLAVVTAVAFGWPQTIIDFFTSPPAPAKVKNFFGAQNVSAPTGMNPQAIPGQTRRIATASFDADHFRPTHPTIHTLYVAPTKEGGFCWLWTKASAGCLPAAGASRSKGEGPLSLTWFSNDYPLITLGWVRTNSAKAVEARFADGTTETIPVTWISAPINAGFLTYTVPPAHRNRSDALKSVVALDGNGNVVGSQDFHLTRPLDQDMPQTLPDGTKVSLSRRAQAARARKVISFGATDGSMVYLWAMPRTGGGNCYLFNQGQGCEIPRFVKQEPVFNGGLSGAATRILLFGHAKPQVATVELRYQNGENERLTPIEGFVLTEIMPAHYKRGTRIVAAVALNASGKAIYTERFRPQETGFYPCKKPINRGYGVKTCP